MVCLGTQNLITIQYGLRYYDCPACKHWGVRFEKIDQTPEDLERYKNG